MIGQSISIALAALAANKLRSILTMLGIIIGVGAVIALLAAGEGVDLLIRTQIQSIGSNLVFVVPRSQGGGGGPPGSNFASSQTLTLGDSNAISNPLNVPEVVAVAPDLASFGKVVYSNKNTNTSIDGVTPAYSEVRNFGVAYGSFINDQDLAAGSRVAVLGQTVVDDLFGTDIYPIDQRIKINNIAFRVIGVLETKGGTGFGNQDDIVLIPLTTAVTRVFKSKSIRGEYPVSVIYAQVASEDQIDSAITNISELLRRRHNLTYRNDDDFSVINQAEF